MPGVRCLSKYRASRFLIFHPDLVLYSGFNRSLDRLESKCTWLAALKLFNDAWKKIPQSTLFPRGKNIYMYFIPQMKRIKIYFPVEEDEAKWS